MVYIAVNEQRCKTREQVARNAAIVFAPAILDEESWNAIDAVGVPAEGHLELPLLYIVGIGYIYAYELPYTLPLGSYSTKAFCNAVNDTDYRQDFKMTIEFLDPDGIAHGKDVDIDDIVGGGSKTMSTPYTTIGNKEGIWKIHAILETA